MEVERVGQGENEDEIVAGNFLVEERGRKKMEPTTKKKRPSVKVTHRWYTTSLRNWGR